MATLVTATCGTDVIGWSPDGASAQQRVFELQHRARVSGTGWLPRGKALAVAGNDCVVNIYSMPDKKVVATVPKTISLPSNPPVITALALSQANVLYGCSDGSINMAKLPDVQVICLCREEGQPIADLAVTPQNKLLAAASQNGNVLLLPFERSATRHVKYLSCKDREARCSLSVSSVGERVACGSTGGGIHVWDAASAAALNFVQDGDRAVSIAFQAQSQDSFYSASASKTLSLWDCRMAKRTTQVDLVKPAASIAAGMAPHDVAIGDGVGVAWLYDMRRPETPRLRLPCGTSHAVTSMQWVPRPSSLDSRSQINRKSGLSANSGPGTAQAVPAPPESERLDPDGSQPLPAEPSGSVSALPRAPSAIREHHQSSMQPHRPVSQTLPAGAALRMESQKDEDQTTDGDVRVEDANSAVTSTCHVATRSLLPMSHGHDAGTNQVGDHGCRNSASHQATLGCVELKQAGKSAGNFGEDDNRAAMPTPTATSSEPCLPRLIDEAVKRVVDTNFAQLNKRLEGIESRVLSRISARSTAEAPAYQTQQMIEHADKATASLKKEIQTWLSEYQEETLKQFHLAQQDLMDVAAALSLQMSTLTASVEQLQARITADEENRRKIAQFM